MYKVTLLATVVLLAGCVNAQVANLGPGTYVLSSDYDFWNPRYGIADYLDREARRQCPNGYQKTAESSKPHGNSDTLTWQVTCD